MHQPHVSTAISSQTLCSTHPQEFTEITMDIQIIIQSATNDLRPTIPPSTPPKMATLIRQCIVKDQENRPTADNIVNSLASIRNDYFLKRTVWDASII